MDTVFIYALNDPRTGRTRYVGKTKDLKSRISCHWADARRARNHRTNWLNQLRLLGLRPVLEVLDTVPFSEWVFWEREWIKLFRALLFDLVNETDGGEGAPGARLSAAHRAKISAAHLGKKTAPEHMAALQRGRVLAQSAPEYVANWRAKVTGQKRTPEQLARLRASMTPERRERAAAAIRGKKHSRETIEKRAAALRGKKRTPEQRARISAGRIKANLARKLL